MVPRSPKVWSIAAVIFLSLFSVAHAQDSADYRRFRTKYRAVDPGDAAALAELAAWCATEGEPAWAAICRRKIVQLGETPQFREAAIHLAEWELSKERFESAYALLEQVLERYDDARARKILEGARTRATERQREHLTAGDEQFGRGKIEKALDQYERAAKLAPDQPSDRHFIPLSTIHAKIARCRARLDQEFYEERVQPVEHDLRACPRQCSRAGGFVSCPPCRGVGKIQKRVRRGGKWIMIWVTCKECGGHKWLACAQCGGMEQVGQRITPKEKRALVKLIDKVRNLKIIKKRYESAVAEIQSILLREDDGPTLAYIRAQKPSYSISRSLRSGIAHFPPDRKELRDARDAWKQAGKDIRIRPNFLRSYAVEFSQFLRPYEMLRHQRKFSFDDAPTADAWPEERVTPEQLAAFPDDYADRWLVVDGTMGSFKVNGPHGVLGVRGDADSHVRFFTWSEEARSALEWFGSSPWKTHVGDLAERYPFNAVAESASQAPAGHRVALVGRLLRDRLGYPRNWFEVWDLQVGFSREQDALFARLREPVTIRFPGVKLSEVAEFLNWYGLELEFDGVDSEQVVTVEAYECAVGRMVDEIARALGVDWFASGSRLVLAEAGRGSDAARHETRTALARIRAEVPAGQRTEVHASIGGATSPLAPEKGGAGTLADAKTLEAQVSEAMATMNYAAAVRGIEKLFAHSDGAEEWATLERRQHRARLYHALTGKTTANTLAEANEVVQLTIAAPGADAVRRHVEVLREEPSHLWVRPGYGGEIRVKKSWLRDRRVISAPDWRREKEEELQALELEIESKELTGQARAQRWFILALFAKTHRFETQGGRYLDALVKDPEFDWVLRTYFGDQRSLLAGWWYALDGKKAPVEDEVEAPIVAYDPKTDDPVELLAIAKSEMAQGRAALGRSLPGMADAPNHRKTALEHIDRASTCLDRLLDRDPNHAEATRLADEIRVLRYDVVKGMGFFD